MCLLIVLLYQLILLGFGAEGPGPTHGGFMGWMMAYTPFFWTYGDETCGGSTRSCIIFGRHDTTT